MDIQPQHITLARLFDKRLFRIPPYQRAYSWQSKHRDDLFDDIQQSRFSGNGQSHFMATVVGLRRRTEQIGTDEYQVVDIVDGQQRITTLIILFKAISIKLDAGTLEEKKAKQEIHDILVKEDKASLLLLQTNHDTSHYFADYIRCGQHPPHSEAKTSADRELLRAMADCEKFVDKWMASGHSLPDLISHVKNRLTFILHLIEDEALVYSVFEVLNSRGLDVSWFDRCKSMLMAIVFNKAGNKDEMIEEVHRVWSDIYGIVGLSLGLSTESLRFAATLQSDRSQNRVLSEEAATDLFRDECKGDPSKVIETSKWIKSVTDAVKRLTEDVRRNAVTQISQARLVAVAIDLRSGLEKDEKKQILDRWESVTFRIFGMHNKDARTGVGDYVSLAWRIFRQTLDFEGIMNELSKIGEEYPIGKGVDNLRETDCYKEWTEKLRYFLCRYEEHLSKESGQNFDNEQWVRIWEASAAKSIEHISPQSKRNKYTRWLGNLMLLPPGLNSKLGDLEPSDKRKKYKNIGLLSAGEVAKSIKSMGWEEGDVRDREDKLLEWAKREWAD